MFILGYTDNRDEIRNRYSPTWIPRSKGAFRRLNEYWEDYIGKLHVDHPDREMNLFVNMWNQYQSKTTFNWSRFVSMYQLGLEEAWA